MQFGCLHLNFPVANQSFQPFTVGLMQYISNKVTINEDVGSCAIHFFSLFTNYTIFHYYYRLISHEYGLT